jgi:hypothetical protein
MPKKKGAPKKSPKQFRIKAMFDEKGNEVQSEELATEVWEAVYEGGKLVREKFNIKFPA